MAQPSKANPETITAAIDRLALRGAKITLQTVKDEIGGGSFGTIQPVLKAWREQQEQTARDQAAQAAEAPEEAGSIPLKVSQALETGRLALEGVAAAVAAAINVAVADERRRGRLELDTEREASDRRIAEAQERARLAEEETSQIATDAAGIEADRDSLLDRVAATEAERDHVAAELAAEQNARQAAQALADQHQAEILALRQTVAQADARVQTAEQRAQQAEAEKTRAEAARVAAEEARAAADAERRAVLAESKEVIERVTADRDQARQDLAAAIALATERGQQRDALVAELTAARRHS